MKTAGDKEIDTEKNILPETFLTPMDKFRHGLGYLSVSDLTAQFWCEQQMEYNFLAPETKPETEQMQLGKDIHLARGKLLNDFLEFKVLLLPTEYILHIFVWRI